MPPVSLGPRPRLLSQARPDSHRPREEACGVAKFISLQTKSQRLLRMTCAQKTWYACASSNGPHLKISIAPDACTISQNCTLQTYCSISAVCCSHWASTIRFLMRRWRWLSPGKSLSMSGGRSTSRVRRPTLTCKRQLRWQPFLFLEMRSHSHRLLSSDAHSRPRLGRLLQKPSCFASNSGESMAQLHSSLRLSSLSSRSSCR